MNGRLRTSTSLPLPPPLGGAGGTQRPAPQTAEGEAGERPLADEHQPPLPLFGGAGRGVYAPSHSRNQAASIEPKGVSFGWGVGCVLLPPEKSGKGAAAAKCGRGLDAFSGEQQGARSQRAIAGTKQRASSHSEKTNFTKIIIIGYCR